MKSFKEIAKRENFYEHFLYKNKRQGVKKEAGILPITGFRE